MSWLKTSDASAWHPMLMRVLEWQLSRREPWLVNEVYGFMSRCAVQCAQHETDYVVDAGVAMQTAQDMGRFEVLVQVCTDTGLLTSVAIPDETTGRDRPGFKIVEEKDLWHMILRSEREWETQRRKDVGNTAWTVEVRRRDGDACRWCGSVVGWGGDKKSGRSGTYDHRVPGQGATGPEDLYVACRTCNSARGDEKNREWNRTLLPPPEEPFYQRATVAWLAKHGVDVRATDHRRPIRSTTSEEAGSTTPAAEQAPQRESAPAQATAAPTDAAGSTAGDATAAPRQGVRDTASRPERQRAAQVRDARGPGEPAAADPAQRDVARRLLDKRKQELLEALAAARGIPQPAPAAERSWVDLAEVEWEPDDAGPPGMGPDLQIPADRQAEGSGFPGSGRDGTCLDGHGPGSGWDVPGRDGSAGGSGGAGKGSGRRRRRGRRGGRGRGGDRGEG